MLPEGGNKHCASLAARCVDDGKTLMTVAPPTDITALDPHALLRPGIQLEVLVGSGSGRVVARGRVHLPDLSAPELCNHHMMRLEPSTSVHYRLRRSDP
jgi:hypothetical protein